MEVETSVLQVSPGNETHLHAPRTELMRPDGSRTRRYLRTSPEFACKKLLAAGETRIFEFARVFRDRERGDLHLPEFTMLEWYRAGAPYDAIMADTVVVIARAAQATGIGTFSFRGRIADPFAEPELLTVAAAFERFAGIDLLSTISGNEGNRAALAGAACDKVRVAEDDTWSDIFSKVLVEHVEPHLGQGRLTILFEYPSPEAALARVKADDPRVAERFEVYACGVELANEGPFFGHLATGPKTEQDICPVIAERNLGQHIRNNRYVLIVIPGACINIEVFGERHAHKSINNDQFNLGLAADRTTRLDGRLQIGPHRIEDHKPLAIVQFHVYG